MDRAQLADLLWARRHALQPEDVGLRRGPRRRVGGLRREEVADLANVSVDYYARIEQQRGALPSPPVLASLAQALRMTADERAHLFLLAGHTAPRAPGHDDHISAGLASVFDRLADVPGEIINHLGETLAQNPPAVALLGDHRPYTGLARAAAYRWFITSDARVRYPEEDHHKNGLVITGHLRAAYTAAGPGSPAGQLVDALLESSEEFARLWHEHAVAGSRFEPKRVLHPTLGVIDVQCQTLIDPDRGHCLLVFTSLPHTDGAEKLRLLTDYLPVSSGVSGG